MNMSQRETLSLLNEGNPFTRVAGKAFGIALRGASEVGKSLISQDLNDLGKQAKSVGKKILGSGKAVPLQKGAKSSKRTSNVESIIKTADRHAQRVMVTSKLKSVGVSGLPTLQSGKKSNKFALMDSNGKLVYIFYPYTSSVLKRPGRDNGFLVWDSIQRKIVNIAKPLRSTKFVKQSGFITLENEKNTRI
jgi:hypothetical protein